MEGFVQCSSPANVVEPFLSITPPIARLIRGARPCPTVLGARWLRRAASPHTGRKVTAARPEDGRKSGIYDIQDESSAMYVCRARIAVLDQLPMEALERFEPAAMESETPNSVVRLSTAA